jgi:hypothetical protein
LLGTIVGVGRWREIVGREQVSLGGGLEVLRTVAFDSIGLSSSRVVSRNGARWFT